MNIVGQAGLVLCISLVQAVFSTLLAIILALPLAHFFYRYDFPFKRIVLALASLFFIMPTKLVILATSLFFGEHGFASIIFAHLMLNIPFAFYLFYLSYQKFDVTLEWVAHQLGATFWQRYSTILFPLLRPTIISTAIVIFLLCFSSFSIPLMLGGTWYHATLEIMTFRMYQDGDAGATLIYTILRWMVVIPMLMVQARKSKTYSLITHYGLVWPVERFKVTSYSIIWLFYGLCIVYCTLGPLTVLVATSLHAQVFHYWSSIFFATTDPWLGVPVYRVIANSVLLGIVSSFGAVLCGFILCYLLSRMVFLHARMSGELLAALSCILGSVGCGILFAWTSALFFLPKFVLAVVCHLFLNYPFTYRIIRAQWYMYNQEWSFIAQSFGAPSAYVMRTLEIPFLKSAFIKAFCIGFGLSLTEVGAGAVLEDSIGLTMPMAIRIYRNQGAMHEALGMSLILVLLVVLLGLVLSARD